MDSVEIEPFGAFRRMAFRIEHAGMRISALRGPIFRVIGAALTLALPPVFNVGTGAFAEDWCKLYSNILSSVENYKPSPAAIKADGFVGSETAHTWLPGSSECLIMQSMGLSNSLYWCDFIAPTHKASYYRSAYALEIFLYCVNSGLLDHNGEISRNIIDDIFDVDYFTFSTETTKFMIYIGRDNILRIEG